MHFSIVIPTYNRADELAPTLRSLSALKSSRPWELIVVDNNSTDDTRAVVEAAARTFPADRERPELRSGFQHHGQPDCAG